MLEVDNFRLDAESLGVVQKRKASKPRKPRSVKGKGFLKGPIPGPWLKVAGALPGKSLHVGLAVWLAYGFEKRERFRFTPKWHAWFEIGPGALRRSLQRLREAGLIEVEYRDGCSPIVTLIPQAEVDEQ